MLSFPAEGYTLALYFGNKGEKTVELLKNLEDMITEAGGRIYPAKDSLMSKEHFLKYYPNFKEFEKHIDPKFSSSFIRRVTK